MLEALVLAGGLGFLLGLRYRVPVVVPASAGAVVLGAVVSYLAGSELWIVVISAVGAVVALQLGYLGGLLLSFLTAPRAKPDHNRDLGSSERYSERCWADAKD
jgi:hypothetical protein